MSLEQERLEAAIDDAPDDASRYAVLGDFLLQLGDPRGELIALQLTERSTRAKREREEELLVMRGLRIPRTQRAQWRWGFVHTLFFGLVQYTAWEEHRDDWTSTLLAPSLEHPSCRFLRELVVDASPGDDTLRFLSTHAPRHLEGLTLTCNELDLSLVGPGLGHLSKLNLFAQLIVPAPLSLPRLLELSLPVDAMTIGGLGMVLGALPSLRKLTLSSLETFDREALFPVTQLRSLESLTLRAEKTSRSAVDALAESPLRESLKSLDVSRSGMTEEAAHRLLALAPKFDRLDSLLLGDAV
ncbi:MAG: hypothetical protein Q8L48_41765 [Archangium sp.]|nr:hypothetical protein [Archangium sp.]